MLDISFIKKIIKDTLEEEGIKKKDLYENGSIFYYNGNDCTDFDYVENGRTCEFYVFYKDTEYGALKLFVYPKKIEIYIYSKDNPQSKAKEKIIDSPFNLKELCEYLYGEFDYNLIYNAKIENWILKDRKKITYTSDEDDLDIW